MINKNRRKFISVMGATTVAIPLTALLASLPSNAADMVDPKSAQAKALQYVATSQTPGQKCGTCTLFQGDKGAASGPCPLFPGNIVSGESWCSAYVPSA